MADTPTGFRDLDHVREWLAQFHRSDIKASTDHASVQMVAALANALAVVPAELDKVRGAGGNK